MKRFAKPTVLLFPLVALGAIVSPAADESSPEEWKRSNPDRKHYLLGNHIPGEMLNKMKVE